MHASFISSRQSPSGDLLSTNTLYATRLPRYVASNTSPLAPEPRTRPTSTSRSSIVLVVVFTSFSLASVIGLPCILTHARAGDRMSRSGRSLRSFTANLRSSRYGSSASATGTDASLLCDSCNLRSFRHFEMPLGRAVIALSVRYSCSSAVASAKTSSPIISIRLPFRPRMTMEEGSTGNSSMQLCIAFSVFSLARFWMSGRRFSWFSDTSSSSSSGRPARRSGWRYVSWLSLTLIVRMRLRQEMDGGRVSRPFPVQTIETGFGVGKKRRRTDATRGRHAYFSTSLLELSTVSWSPKKTLEPKKYAAMMQPRLASKFRPAPIYCAPVAR
mmetsp:Transcript_14698/g.41906  ORF Transcript_14698/g.41906 Transcript_14698/m.41906 type:complete len:329 (-) Transcript_14698:70-1056(-)